MEVRLAGRGLKKEKDEEEEEACWLARLSLEGSCHATRHATRHDLLKVTPNHMARLNLARSTLALTWQVSRAKACGATL